MRMPYFARLKISLNGKLSLWEKFSMLPGIEKLFDIYYDIRAWIEWMRRAFDYAKLGYKNYDFDALTIERYLLFKLKRVQDALINGHVDLTVEMGPKKMKALKLCIKLLERLNGHYHRFLDMHDAKWGEMECWFEPTERGDGSSYWRSKRPKANTPELQEQERKEFLEAVRADDREEMRDRRLVYRIIEKYICYWWD
jgi:hypothetical protein